MGVGNSFSPAFKSADTIGLGQDLRGGHPRDGILTLPGDGGIHSSLLLKILTLLDLGQALLSCHPQGWYLYPSVGWGGFVRDELSMAI